jgi:hypothetical protein
MVGLLTLSIALFMRCQIVGWCVSGELYGCRGLLFQSSFVLFAGANKKIYVNSSIVILRTVFGITNVVDTKSPCTARLGNCVLVGTYMCTYFEQPTGSVQALCLNKRHTMIVCSFKYFHLETGCKGEAGCKPWPHFAWEHTCKGGCSSCYAH